MERRLAAILITDMVGYSRLMSRDEADIFTRQQELRASLIDPKVAAYGGRVVKSTGDGILAMFHSVVDALRCAVMLQLEISAREQARPQEDRISYRMGVNLGDIILEAGDIYGDGVNLAARLMQMAGPGEFCVAETVAGQVRGRVASGFEDLGRHELKNIPGPVRIYRVKKEAEKQGDARPSLVLGGFTYDPGSGGITGPGGSRVHLRAQSQKVLAVLAETPGEIVSRERIVQAVWPGIATTGDSLVQCIADIRRAVGHQAVETYPKKGYRLCPGAPAEAPAGQRLRRWMPSLLPALLLALAIALAALLWERRPAQDDQAITPPAVAPERTLAVLPFTNLSGDPDLRFFSDGLSEDLTTDLSKADGLTVISYASSIAFQNAEQAFQEIAQTLRVRYLVRGTVRHHGARVRINVSLIDPYARANLWAERYDRDTGNPFDVQEEVTRRIVEALALTLGRDGTPAESAEPDARYMLLRGLEPLRSFTAEGNAEARSFFERALEIDPEYARAYAHIAVTYGRETAFRYSGALPPEAVAKGLEAAITAIRLDAAIPDAYYALGVLNLALGKYDNALAAARHAIKLDQNFADGYALLAEAGVHGGGLDEALAAIRRAKLLHPRHPVTYDWAEGHILFQLGRYGEARPLLEKVAAQAPGFYRGLVVLAANYGHEGDLRQASKTLAAARSARAEHTGADDSLPQWYRSEDRQNRLLQGLRGAELPR